MEEKIREIVSQFIKVPAAQIAGDTPVGRAALGSSILLHRMFARLGEAGLVVSDYASVKVFGDLVGRQGAGNSEAPSVVYAATNSNGTLQRETTAGIGIDIEEVSSMPRVADLRKEEFYVQNFTPAEIAYCILQVDPYASLTGLFAAKEAIVKSDGQYRVRPFNMLEIGHSVEGKPEFPGFSLSISHAGGMAVAVAVRGGAGGSFGAGGSGAANEGVAAPAAKIAGMGWIAWLALLLAMAALLVALKH